MSFFSKFEQNIKASTVNSSEANLDASGTFTGTADSTLGIAGIQISLKTDQNCTITVEQSPDDAPAGPHWDIVDTYNYYAGGNFGVTVQAISSYFRVTVTNLNTATATTYFRLQSVLCPIVEAIPRSLDENGHLVTAVHNVKDLYGWEVENTPMGEMRVITPTRLVGANFDQSTLDTNFWITSVNNDGTVTQTDCEVTLATNTSSNGSSALYSVRRARYVSGFAQRYRTQIKLSSGVENNKRIWGVAYGSTMPTITSGAYFELDGSIFSVVTMKSGIETRVSSGSFNGNLGLTFNPGTSNRSYEIYYNNGKVWFVVGDTLLHTVSASSVSWTSTLSFNIIMKNINSSDISSNNTMVCRVASIARLGPEHSEPIYKYISGASTNVLKYSGGNLHRIIINSGGNGSSITIYDNTSGTGTRIGYIETFKVSAPTSIDFMSPFYNGLTVVVVGTVTFTVIYE